MKRPLIAILLTHAGCASVDLSSCPPGALCNQAPPSTLQLAADLTPPTGSPLARQELASLIFDEHGNAVIALAPTTRIDGIVLGEGGARVPAQIVVTGPSAIPGRPSLTVQATADAMGQFTLLLAQVPGASYTVRVQPISPADALYAPATWPLSLEHDRLQTPGEGIKPDPLVLCLGGGSTGCPAASGPRLWLQGRVVSALQVGLAGVRVNAVDATTGEPRSSVATTSMDGAFELSLSPELSLDDRVRVVATPDPKLVLPTLVREVALQPSDTLVLGMPALPAAQSFSLPIGGRSPSGVERMLAGARVEFVTDLSSGYADGTKAQLVTSAFTDETGLATVDLVPGTNELNRTYSVTVSPPADSIFARSADIALEVGPKGGVLGGVPLGLRPQVMGHLVSPTGGAVGGAVVSAQLAAQAVSTGAQDATQFAAPMAVTGSDGSFALHVDPRAAYDIDLVPLPTQALARWSLDDRAVGDGDLDLRTVSLPPAVLTQVTVLDQSGNPVDGVELRVYSISYLDGCAEPDSGGLCPPLPARLRGDGVTRSGGRAAILLPAP